jgi:hypothetical protein
LLYSWLTFAGAKVHRILNAIETSVDYGIELKSLAADHCRRDKAGNL